MLTGHSNSNSKPQSRHLRGQKFALAIFLLVTSALYIHATEPEPIDCELATNALAVLRVELLVSSTGPTCSTYLVRPKHVFKNQTTLPFKADTPVLGLTGKAGVPAGESTIYLVHYDLVNKRFNTNAYVSPPLRLILVGGDATKGVSHIKPPKAAE